MRRGGKEMDAQEKEKDKEKSGREGNDPTPSIHEM